MAKTGFDDVIVPEVFGDYVQVLTTAKSAVVQSGIATSNPVLEGLAAAGGDTVNMPYWGPLTGASQVLPDGTDDAALTTGQMTAASMLAVKQYRGNGWAANDMAALVAGADPMMAIANQVARWWIEDEQARLVQVLGGLFTAGGALALTHLYDVSGGGRKLNGEVVIEAAQLLGDYKETLTAIAMHSAKHSSLQAQGLIEYVRDPATNEVAYSTYLGKRVIMDDDCPYSNGVYTSYLFGEGAFARVPVPVKVPVETFRNAAKGDDELYVRQGLILHPAGCSYDFAVGGRNPTNATLATAASWTRQWDRKLIRIVAIKTR